MKFGKPVIVQLTRLSVAEGLARSIWLELIEDCD